MIRGVAAADCLRSLRDAEPASATIAHTDAADPRPQRLRADRNGVSAEADQGQLRIAEESSAVVERENRLELVATAERMAADTHAKPWGDRIGNGEPESVDRAVAPAHERPRNGFAVHHLRIAGARRPRAVE